MGVLYMCAVMHFSLHIGMSSEVDRGNRPFISLAKDICVQSKCLMQLKEAVKQLELSMLPLACQLW